jgi:hypothetical protein
VRALESAMTRSLVFSAALPASLAGGAGARPDHPIIGNSAMSESCPRFRGELLGRRTLANEKMVNRVGCHKCGVTLWQM